MPLPSCIFVAVAMLFDPAILVRQPFHLLLVVAIIMVGKSLAAFLIVLAFRYPLSTALTISASLAQIGEFSFILASLGLALGLLSLEGQNLILAGALFSIALNPLLFKAVDAIQLRLQARRTSPQGRIRGRKSSVMPIRLTQQPLHVCARG
jgi:K+:H+ antiporter